MDKMVFLPHHQMSSQNPTFQHQQVAYPEEEGRLSNRFVGWKNKRFFEYRGKEFRQKTKHTQIRSE